MNQKIKKVYEYLKNVFSDMGKRNLGAFSAQAAFFTFVSLIPFCAIMFGIIGLIPFADNAGLKRVMESLPPIVSDIVLGAFESEKGFTAGAVIPVSVIGTLWASSKGVFSVIRGIHSAYGEESENTARDRARSVIYILVFILMIILSLVFVAFGNLILSFLHSHLPAIKEITFIKEGMRLLFLTAFVSLVHLLLYMFSLGKRKKFSSVWIGAAFAGVGWTAVSYFYSLYLDYYLFSGGTLYGDLAAVVFLLLWLYACMYTTLIGAFVNKRLTERFAK